ncbi:MAG: hypothetical protein SNI51_07805 [Rikenellaceae bacterium]
MKKLILVAVAAIFAVGSLMAQPPQREQISVEKRVEQLKEQLDLSNEQCAQMTELFENQEAPERGNREAMEKMMEAEKEGMKSILTEEQYASWEELMKKQRPQRGGDRR